MYITFFTLTECDAHGKRKQKLNEEKHQRHQPAQQRHFFSQDTSIFDQSELSTDEEESHSDSDSEDDFSSVTGDFIFSGGHDATDVDTEYFNSDVKYPAAADQDEEEKDESDDDISLSNIHSVTDDGYDAGPEEQRVVL